MKQFPLLTLLSFFVLPACNQAESASPATDSDGKVARSPYQCSVIYSDTSFQEDPMWTEEFTFAAADDTQSRVVGATSGGLALTVAVARETNSLGPQINLVIVENTSSTTTVAQYPEGAAHLNAVYRSGDDKQLQFYCEKTSAE